MKPLGNPFLLSTLFLGFTPIISAQTLYWNPGTLTNTWDATSTYWASTSGGSPTLAWSSGGTAIFDQTATYTVTLSGAQTASAFGFSNGNVTLDLGGTSQTLDNLSITAPSANTTATFTNGSLTLNGASDLVITPGVTTSGRTVLLDASGLSSLSISKSANSLTVGGFSNAAGTQTGTFKLSSASNTITVANLNVGTIGGSGSIVNSGTLSLGTTNSINAANIQIGGTRSNADLSFQTGLTNPTLTLRGVTGGTSSVTKFIVGVNGAGGTPGNTQVADFSLGSIDARITDLIVSQGQSTATTGTPPSVRGTFTMGLGSLTATNIIVSDNISGGGNSTNTGIFNQNAGVVTVGTLTLGQRTGTLLTPILSSSYNLGTSTTTGILKATTVKAGNGTVSTSSVRNINFANGTIQNYDSETDLLINGLDTTAQGRINIILAATGTHTFLADAGRTITLGANTSVSGTNGTLTKAGAGTLVINSAATYTGATTINEGTVTLGGVDRLPTGTNLTLANTAGVLLNLNNNNQTLGSLSGGGANGGNVAIGNATLKVGNANNTTFSGLLSGTGSLVKVGAGSLTLSGNTTASLAGMNISGGTLVVTAGNYTITGGASPSSPDSASGFIVSRGGTFRLDGGNVTASGGSYVITSGNTGGGGNNFILDSGTFDGGNREVLNSFGSTGTFTMNGGLFIGGEFRISQSATGSVNLNGGTLRVSNLKYSNADAIVNFDGGTLQAKADRADFITTTVTQANIKAGGATIDSNGFNITIPKALTGDTNSSGGGLTKAGTGSLTLTAANTYTGATHVTNGTLALSGSGSISGSSAIIVGASSTFDVSGVTGGFALASGQTLSGSGTVAGAMNVSGTLSPGNSPGTLATGSQTWLDGGDYNWQILDTTGVAGTGYDTLAVTGTLDLSSLSSGGFNINLWSLASIGPDLGGDALNFIASNPYSWTLATATTEILGFNAANFVINIGANNGTGGFSNGLNGGAFSVTQSGNNLVLNFTPVPEPRAALLGGLGLLALLRRRR